MNESYSSYMVIKGEGELKGLRIFPHPSSDIVG